jgi:O-glycosyl hydrolase
VPTAKLDSTVALRWFVLAALSVGALGGVSASSGARAEGASEVGILGETTVVVDLSKRFQVMQGFGASERVWSDPHLSQQGAAKSVVPSAAQAAILTALYRRLGLTRVRVVLDPGIQPARGAPFNFKGKLGEDQLAFVRQAKAFGLRTYFPGPVYLEDWMKPDDPAAYVNYAMTVLRYWRSHGLEPALYAPLNEPEITHDFPAKWMHDVVVMLGRRLRVEGFKTKLVVPDDENPVSAYERSVAVLADPQARQYVAALAYHIYKGEPRDWDRMRSLAARYKLPVWMTEYTTKEYGTWPNALNWAIAMHMLITVGGVSAIDYLWGFFGDWVGAESMISIRFDNGVYRSHSFTPVYWLTGQYSRFVRPGYRRVAATTTSRGVLTTAFAGQRRVVVVAVNPQASPVRVRFMVRGGRIEGPVSATRTSATERWRALPARTVERAGFRAVLEPQSVTTFLVRR